MSNQIMTETIDSLDRLCEAAENARGSFGRNTWFRGQRDCSWDLVPKVFRDKIPSDKLNDYEASLAYKFQAGAKIRYPNCPPDDDHFGWLTLMQHYGLPTRLLDWTESILVAAYFAVAEENKTQNSIIWALSAPDVNYDHRNIILSKNTTPVRFHAAEAFKKNQRHDNFIAVVPPENDLRLLVQHARFTMHPPNNPALNHNPHCQMYLKKIEIPQSFRSKLLKVLDQFNINEPSLFPDLQHLAEGIVKSESTQL